MASDLEKNYGLILQNLKEKIRQARQRASLSVNKELLTVYWEIGKLILEQKEQQGWGTKVVKQLAIDLKTEFPDMKGFSDRNLIYMQTFAAAYPNFIITQQAAAQLQNTENQSLEITQPMVAQLPWTHHTVILDKVEKSIDRLFYINKTIQNGWSKSVLIHQIESGLHKRQGALTHNFKNTLPAYQSELTQQLFKDPYQLDFIMLGEAAKERDLENALMNHVTNFLLELGDGFAFMGRQRKFEAGGKEFFIDLLFYHTKLRRHIVIELKIGEFEAEFVSKINLYLELTDNNLKGKHDEPAIGLILCKTKNKIVAEYALRDITKPIGIAEYKITEMLPESIKGELPSIEEIEQKLDEEIKENSSPVDARLKAVKEKIKSLQSDEIQTSANHKILQDLFNTGLKPLYQQIIQKLNSEFGNEFLSQKFHWRYNGHTSSEMEDLAAFWTKEENFKPLLGEVDFDYIFHGFKKGGTETMNEAVSLKFLMSEHWYGFTLVNHNNQQPFLKKLYHQPITSQDCQETIDLLVSKILDRIEWIIENVNNKARKK